MSKTAFDHQTICVSLYEEDVRRLDAKVAELNRRNFRPHTRGHRHMTRSALIRLMIEWLDVERLAPAPAPSAEPPVTTPALVPSRPPSRLRLRQLTRFEIQLASKHPAVASLLASL